MTHGLFGQIEADDRALEKPGRRDHLTFRGNVSTGRHGWLRLTPAYSLHLVHELLKKSGPDELVLEPFSGTGTTPLACASLGLRCHAVDVNPFLVWLGNLKLTRFEAGIADEVSNAAIEIAQIARKPDAAAWKPNLHAIEKWWDEPTLNTLATICEAIRDPCQNRNQDVSSLLRVAFCRALIQTANVSFGHQSMSFKKNDNDLDEPLVREPAHDCAGRIAKLFLTAAKEVANSLSIDPPIREGRVLLGDSRKLAAILPTRGYTAVITSPPYPNRMSYIRELRPYMYWLGFLADGRAAGELDWKAIGGTWGCATSLLGSWAADAQIGIPFPQFDRIVRQIGDGHSLLGRYVHKYFQDIKGHIAGLRDVLVPGARCHYIVGNSKFYDTMLPVEEIYAAIFKDAGFVDVSIEKIRKRSSKKELFEFIVHAHMPTGARRAG